MIEVFKTNINSQSQADHLKPAPELTFPDCRFNFDLDDCDRIFRIESAEDVSDSVIRFFMLHNFDCSVLT